MMSHFLSGEKKKVSENRYSQSIKWHQAKMLEDMLSIHRITRGTQCTLLLSLCSKLCIRTRYEMQYTQVKLIKRYSVLFPYLDKEGMSYLKSLGWMEGQKEIGESCKEKKKRKSQCLAVASGSLSSLTVSCNINMSEQRSRAYHAACNNCRWLGLLP